MSFYHRNVRKQEAWIHACNSRKYVTPVGIITSPDPLDCSTLVFTINVTGSPVPRALRNSSPLFTPMDAWAFPCGRPFPHRHFSRILGWSIPTAFAPAGRLPHPQSPPHPRLLCIAGFTAGLGQMERDHSSPQQKTQVNIGSWLPWSKQPPDTVPQGMSHSLGLSRARLPPQLWLSPVLTQWPQVTPCLSTGCLPPKSWVCPLPSFCLLGQQSE